MVHETAIVEPGASVGEGTNIWHWTHVREGAKIGKDCNIGQCVYIDNDVVIGDRCKIQNGANLYGPLEIGDDVFIGPGAVVCNDAFPRAYEWDRCAAPLTQIMDKASIGAMAVVLPWTIVGHGAMVGAGSVVTRNVPRNSVVTGVPAEVVRLL